MSRFYTQVPKDLEENLQYRKALRLRADGQPQVQAQLITACKHDVLFFFNAFCYLFEPRPRFFPDGRKKSNVIPFITWPHQDKAVLEILQHLGREDVGIIKSRGEGASWIAILLAVHGF